jgi:hypothetical protein
MAQKKFKSDLFVTDEPEGYTGSKGGLANFLKPVGGDRAWKTIDVVFNYPWTTTPSLGRTEAPFVILHEFRLLDSALKNNIRYYATGAVQTTIGNVTDIQPQNDSTGSHPYYRDNNLKGYAGLFDFKHPTRFNYILPYFNETVNSVNSTWNALDIMDKIKGIAGDKVGGAVEDIVGAAGFVYEAGYPRVGIMDRPKLWNDSQFRSIEIKFPLFNTLDFSDIKKNWDLCYLLLYQNMFNKRDFVTAIPPVFYTVNVPGQFFSLAAYVSDLKIYNRGHIRRIDIDGSKKLRNIPDVFEISMTLTDMCMPSQNMQSILLSDSPVEVRTLGAITTSERNAATQTSQRLSQQEEN